MSLLERRLQQAQAAREAPAPEPTGEVLDDDKRQIRDLESARAKVREKLLQRFDVEAMGNKNDPAVQAKIRQAIAEIIDKEHISLARMTKPAFIAEMSNDILGLGPLQPLVDDETVTEIMVNGPSQVYIERDGKIELTPISFPNNDAIRHLIERIVAPLGRRIDESRPMVDARLPDGSRVNAIIPPLALNGCCLTIRKFRKALTISELLKFGSLTQEVADFIEACVKTRLNIMVSGGTGSGKTSLLNCLSSYIPDSERIVTIEDSAELQLQQAHKVRLETKEANIEGTGAVAIRDLVKNSLRMRPDRIVVGEVRGAEALDMLTAMNTGHDGCLTTLHANSPADALSRLETMVMFAGEELPHKAIREQIAAALDLVIHVARMQDGTRKVTQITEIQGMGRGRFSDKIFLQDIFVFRHEGFGPDGKVLGKLVPTGKVPKCLEKFRIAGVPVPAVFAGMKQSEGDVADAD